MFRLFICPKIEQFEHLKFTRYSIYLKENNDQRDTAGLGESLNWGMEHVFAWGGEKNSGLLKGGNRLLFKTVSSLWSFTNPIGLYVQASATHIVVECIRVCQCLFASRPYNSACLCLCLYVCMSICVCIAKTTLGDVFVWYFWCWRMNGTGMLRALPDGAQQPLNPTIKSILSGGTWPANNGVIQHPVDHNHTGDI